MAQGRVAQRVEDILSAIKDSGIPLNRATSISITYKEMGEFAGDLPLPVIEIKTPDLTSKGETNDT